MEDVLAALADQHRRLAVVVDGCRPADWERPTRCPGWDVAAVLLHLAQTDALAAASARGELDAHPHGFMGNPEDRVRSVDEAAAAQVDLERAAGADAIRARWHDASRDMRTAFEAGDPHRRVTWVSGQLSLHTLVTTRLSECWIHTDDIATALDLELEPTDGLRHIARLAWRTLPYAFGRAGEAMHGPVALDLRGPGGDRWRFDPDDAAVTVIRGSAVDFCEVAARRVDPAGTDLVGEGPDAAAVLELVRTYAV
ncbi:MAG TPA: maleylpyruvate isomerase family mycothiol-dependent enzyme [Acidimicrobiales bacterium]|nr:maleylpyruvate isomerase family mycothiol-dependent enzyme [Acidimicrobiales bacterium]